MAAEPAAVLQLEWSDLRQQALRKLGDGVCDMHASENDIRSWDGILLRFRKLREALTAATAQHTLRCEVYELSAVVCAAARNMAELLKCLQQLTNSIYPALPATAATCQQEQQELLQQQDGCAELQQVQQQLQNLHIHASHGAAVLQTSRDSSSTVDKDSTAYWTYLLPCNTEISNSNAGPGPHEVLQLQQQRQVEVAAALLLYFACVPRKPVVQEVVKQLKIAACCYMGPQTSSNNTRHRTGAHQSHQLQQGHGQRLLLHQPHHQLAVRAAAAVLTCNWIQFMRRYEEQPPLLVKVVMECAVQRMRTYAVQTVVSAYRMLPSAVLVRWLGFGHEHKQERQDKTQEQGDEEGWCVETQLHVLRQRQNVMRVLQLAAEQGSKGAATALTQCAGNTTELPDTLQFRG